MQGYSAVSFLSAYKGGYGIHIEDEMEGSQGTFIGHLDLEYLGIV